MAELKVRQVEKSIVAALKARAGDVIAIPGKVGADGTLTWKAPTGQWRVLRVGCTLNDHCRVSTCSQGWDGYAIDPFDAGAFTRYWRAVVEPLALQLLLLCAYR